jgi:hypothetical protein
VRARLLVASLIYLGPLVRSLERYRWRIRGLTEVHPIAFTEPVQPPRIVWREAAFLLSYWTDDGLEKEGLLQALAAFLVPRKYFVAYDQGWSDWDIQVYRGIWSKAQLKVVGENHGSGKRLLRVRAALKMTRPALIALATYPALAAVALAAGLPPVAVAILLVGLAHAGAILYQGVRLSRILYQVLEIVAQGLGLVPVRERS